jgi:hypothetical protein
MYSKPNAIGPLFHRSIPAYCMFFMRPAVGLTHAATSAFFGSSMPQKPKRPQFFVKSKPTCAQPPVLRILPNWVMAPNCWPIPNPS